MLYLLEVFKGENCIILQITFLLFHQAKVCVIFVFLPLTYDDVWIYKMYSICEANELAFLKIFFLDFVSASRKMRQDIFFLLHKLNAQTLLAKKTEDLVWWVLQCVFLWEANETIAAYFHKVLWHFPVYVVCWFLILLKERSCFLIIN